MKKIAVIAVILITASFARANLIDLTPGGFSFIQPFPKVVDDFFNKYGLAPGEQMNIAGANIVNGLPEWSPFTIFNTDHFGIASPVGAVGDVTWGLTGTGYHLTYVLTSGPDFIGNLYQVGGLNWLTGSFPVTVNGTLPLDGISFVGRTGVPDTGSTLLLLGIAVVIIFGLYRIFARPKINLGIGKVMFWEDPPQNIERR